MRWTVVLGSGFVVLGLTLVWWKVVDFVLERMELRYLEQGDSAEE
jgi:hypothetical protein